MRVKFKDKRQFESCWVKDISNGGIFLRTQTPVALFGRLTIVLELPNGDSVELQGEVVRVVPPEQAGPGVAAGMGVQFVDLTPAKRELLENYLGGTKPEYHGPSNALIESTNTKIRLLQRMAFGFASPDALIALAMLALGGHRPALPGRV